ncbi:MAG: hypothetical protein V5A32_02375, partial [Halovenus sp.]
AAGIVSSTLLYIFESQPVVTAAVVPTVAVGFLLYRSFRKQRGIQAQPKFTRQRMRERESDEGGREALGFGDAVVAQSGMGNDESDSADTPEDGNSG